MGRPRLLLPAAIAAFAVFALSQGLSSFGLGRTAAQQAACGTDRPDVQTLTDSSVGNIDLTQVISVNISTLAALPAPDPVPAVGRFDPYETTVYTVTGNLVQASLQPDGEIDVEIQDPDTGDTIVATLPDAAQCAQGASAQFLQLMESARQTFVQAYGLPQQGASLPLSGTATLVGVGFLDPVLGQTGEAPNGMGVHPVLDFEAQTSAAGPATSVTPSSSAPAVSATPQGALPSQPGTPPSTASPSP